MRKITVFLIMLFIFISSTSYATAVQQTFPCSNDDGYVLYSHADYTTANERGIADSTNDGGNELKVGQSHSGNWSIYRSAFYFSTSGIPDSVNIQKAWLYYKINSNPMAINIISDSGLTVPHDPLATSDFNRLLYDYNNWPLDSGSSTGWKNIIVYDDDRTPGLYRSIPISKTGTTKFLMMTNDDFNKDDSSTGIMTIASANSGNAPYLEVQYNTAPNTPTVSGSDEAIKEQYYTLTITGTDDDVVSENNRLKYKIDWGDGETSWAPGSGYVESGETVTKRHKYTGTGNKQIKVTAYDNSDESNDQSSQATKTISVEASAISKDEDKSWWDSFLEFLGFDDGEEEVGPNQRFKRLNGEFESSGQGTKNMLIWWEINEKAAQQEGLMVDLFVETTTGKHNLGRYRASNHMTKEDAVYILDWDTKDLGEFSEWSFVLKANFVNPTEPDDCNKEDNKIELRYILGLPLYQDAWIAALIFLIIVIMIILAVVFRKKLFWRFYAFRDKQEIRDKINDMPDGHMKEWLEKKLKRMERKEKRQKVLDELLKNVKKSATKKAKKTARGPTNKIKKKTTSTFDKWFRPERYMVAKIAEEAAKNKTKPKKIETKKKKKDRNKNKKTRSKRKKSPSSSDWRIKTINDLKTKPYIIPPKDFPGVEEITKSKKYARYRTGNPTQQKKLKNLLADSNRVWDLGDKLNSFRNVLVAPGMSGRRVNKLRRLVGDEFEDYEKLQTKYQQGKISDKEFKEKMLNGFNMLEDEMVGLIEKRSGYKAQFKKTPKAKQKQEPWMRWKKIKEPIDNTKQNSKVYTESEYWKKKTPKVKSQRKEKLQYLKEKEKKKEDEWHEDEERYNRRMKKKKKKLKKKKNKIKQKQKEEEIELKKELKRIKKIESKARRKALRKIGSKRR